MRSAFDFTPYRQSWIGYDHLFDLLENARQTETSNSPSFDLEQKGNNAYRLRLAVAGFRQEDLDITTSSNLLVVSGRIEHAERKWLYRGISSANFERQFQLADYVVVTGAQLMNGVLEIDLERQIPDEIKPRKIEIATESPRADNRELKRRTRGQAPPKVEKPSNDDAAEGDANSAMNSKMRERTLTGAW